LILLREGRRLQHEPARLRRDDRCGAGVIHGIGSSAAIETVGTRAANQGVVAEIAEQLVAAQAAVQPVIAEEAERTSSLPKPDRSSSNNVPRTMLSPLLPLMGWHLPHSLEAPGGPSARVAPS
jgi:hypothetical protein